MELKVVINFRDNRSVVGVQSPDKDPHFVLVKGDLTQTAMQIPVIVAAAEEKWKTQPKNPTINLPKPELKKEAVTASSKSGSGGAKAKAVPGPQVQQPMF